MYCLIVGSFGPVHNPYSTRRLETVRRKLEHVVGLWIKVPLFNCIRNLPLFFFEDNATHVRRLNVLYWSSRDASSICIHRLQIFFVLSVFLFLLFL